MGPNTMEPATWISLGAMLIALGVLFINAWKAFRERRAEIHKEIESLTKAGAERDNIAVHSAEGALLLMEKMLNTATLSETRQREQAVMFERRFQECNEALETARLALMRRANT